MAVGESFIGSIGSPNRTYKGFSNRHPNFVNYEIEILGNSHHSNISRIAIYYYVCTYTLNYGY